MEALKRTLEFEVGDLTPFGIDISLFTNAQSLIDTLKQKSFTTLHKIEEVQAGLSSPSTDIVPAFIYSYDGVKGYRYQEPAVMVTGPNTREFFDAAVKVGHSMHQARFSYEDLKGHAFNLEILEFSENAAARMR